MSTRKKRSALLSAKDEIELDRDRKLHQNNHHHHRKSKKVVSIVLNFGVLVSAIYEGIYARRGGDPTRLGRNHYSEHRGATFSNPGYRENRHSNNGGGISMTDASGKPYVGGGRSQHGNGSMASVATSGISVVSSVGSPLRSSLKKPKPLGIQNPGFSSTSPQLQRNGSQKKVRIQTHSTEV